MNRATILATISKYGDKLLAAGNEHDFKKRIELLDHSLDLYKTIIDQLVELEERAAAYAA